MAVIGNGRIHDAKRIDGGSVWLFEIKYTAYFSQNEVGQEFDDAVKIWEDDGGGSDDDQISVYDSPETFLASSNSVERTKFKTIAEDDLDTEWEEEQPYAKIWLRRHGSTGPADDERTTDIYPVDV